MLDDAKLKENLEGTILSRGRGMLKTRLPMPNFSLLRLERKVVKAVGGMVNVSLWIQSVLAL